MQPKTKTQKPKSVVSEKEIARRNEADASKRKARRVPLKNAAVEQKPTILIPKNLAFHNRPKVNSNKKKALLKNKS